MLLSVRVMMAVAFVAGTAQAGAATEPTAQYAESLSKCLNKGNAFSPDERIAGCSALMRDNLTQKELAYALNDRGLAFQAKDEYGRAIADYTDAIRLDPNFAHASYNRGTAYQAQGDYALAIVDYSYAIRLNPTYFRAYKNRGLAYQAKGDYDRANSDLNEASRLRR